MLIQHINSMLKTNITKKTFIISLLAAVVTGAAVAYYTMPGYAQSPQDLQSEINQIENKIQQSKDRLSELHDKEDTLENKLEIIKTDINKIQNELQQTREEIATKKAEIRETERELQRKRELMQENAKTLYKEGDPSTMEILFSSDNFSDFMSRKQYLDSVKDSLNEAAKEVKELQKKLKNEKTNLENKRREQASKKQELQARRNEQQHLLEETRGEEARYQERVEELKRQRQEAQEALANLNLGRIASEGPVEAGETIGAVGHTGYSTGYHLHFEIRNNGGHVNPATYLNGGWLRPTEGAITQPYGVASGNYIGGVHPGIDYGGAGNPIIASSAGTLYRGCSDRILNIERPAYGYVAVIDHGNGIESFYGHMEAPNGASCDYAYF